MRKQLTIACVLKTGGDYDIDYVERLAAGMRRQASHMNYHFVCMTDLYRPLVPGVIFVPLKYDLPGWWSKMELFRISGPIITFDLDVVIASGIDGLIEAALALQSGKIIMLRGWRDSRWSSCIMGWGGSFKWLLQEFLSQSKAGKFEKRNHLLHFIDNDDAYWGDQLWMERHICYDGNEPIAAQKVQPGLYSYKWHIRKRKDRSLSSDASVICFHGKPRPREVAELPWMRRCWAK